MMERIKKLETHQPQNKRHALTGQSGKFPCKENTIGILF